MSITANLAHSFDRGDLMTDGIAKAVALRFRHAAIELREVRRCDEWEDESNRLLARVSSAVRDAYHAKLLPGPIVERFDHIHRIEKVSGIERFWAHDIVGYNPGDAEPYTETMQYEEHGCYKFIRFNYFLLKPGLISLAWPNVFDTFREGLTAIDPVGRCSDAHKLWVSEKHAILGLYATAFDLLAEWVETHADDDHDDRIRPGDGLHCNDTIFVWGGKTFTSIGTTMAPVLKVLMRAYRQGRDATTDEFDTALGSEIRNGFGSLFSVGKSPNKTIHPVRSVILPPHGKGRKKYRLIDPVAAK